MPRETDPLLRRLERTAAVSCVMMAAAAVVLARGDWRLPAGVLGGGLLIAISYRTIGSGVSGLVDLLTGPREPDGEVRRRTKIGRTMLAVVCRYALLGLLAYVMIARLRLHPLGLLAGASSVVAAAAIEAGRLLMKKS